MNEIDFDDFWGWAVDHFGKANTVEHGDEVCINSPFTEKRDTGHHLWCNPAKGTYHCWESGRSGTLYQLVREVTGCSQARAVEILKYEDNQSLSDWKRGFSAGWQSAFECVRTTAETGGSLKSRDGSVINLKMGVEE